MLTVFAVFIHGRLAMIFGNRFKLCSENAVSFEVAIFPAVCNKRTGILYISFSKISLGVSLWVLNKGKKARLPNT